MLKALLVKRGLEKIQAPVNQSKKPTRTQRHQNKTQRKLCSSNSCFNKSATVLVRFFWTKLRSSLQRGSHWTVLDLSLLDNGIYMTDQGQTRTKSKQPPPNTKKNNQSLTNRTEKTETSLDSHGLSGRSPFCQLQMSEKVANFGCIIPSKANSKAKTKQHQPQSSLPESAGGRWRWPVPRTVRSRANWQRREHACHPSEGEGTVCSKVREELPSLED